MDTRRIVLIALTVPLLAATLTACGGPDLSTSCDTYLNSSSSNQKDLAKAYLTDVLKVSKEPGSLKILAAQEGLKVYCKLHGADHLSDISVDL